VAEAARQRSRELLEKYWAEVEWVATVGRSIPFFWLDSLGDDEIPFSIAIVRTERMPCETKARAT